MTFKNYGVYSYIMDIWEENYSTELLPVQEEAVRNYGILDYDGERGDHLPEIDINKTNVNGNRNLMVISPTSSGKTFIGEMAAIGKHDYCRKKMNQEIKLIGL